jgi:hypothetical protein
LLVRKKKNQLVAVAVPGVLNCSDFGSRAEDIPATRKEKGYGTFDFIAETWRCMREGYQGHRRRMLPQEGGSAEEPDLDSKGGIEADPALQATAEVDSVYLEEEGTPSWTLISSPRRRTMRLDFAQKGDVRGPRMGTALLSGGD